MTREEALRNFYVFDAVSYPGLPPIRSLPSIACCLDMSGGACGLRPDGADERSTGVRSYRLASRIVTGGLRPTGGCLMRLARGHQHKLPSLPHASPCYGVWFVAVRRMG